MRVMASADWTPERVKAFWDRYAGKDHLRSTYFSLQVGPGIVRFLQRAGVLRGDVLDYGCGPGYLCKSMLDAGASCQGCDWSPTSVRLANEALAGRQGWRGAIDLGSQLEALRPASYDLITCIETVEHIPESAEGPFLERVRALLKPGGALFVTTPNREALERAMVYCPFCDVEFHGMQHVRSFDERALVRSLERMGFSVRLSGAIDFGSLQEPLWPGIADLSVRQVMRSARRAAFDLYDAVKKEPFPSLFRRQERRAPLPSLCAIAVRHDAPARTTA